MNEIGVVLPTYNEATNLPVVIPHLLSLEIGQLGILIVGDNSPDGTGEIAELPTACHGRIQVLHHTGLQRGLGLYGQVFARC